MTGNRTKKTAIISALALFASMGAYAIKGIALTEGEVYEIEKKTSRVKADLNHDGVTDLVVYNEKGLSIYFSNEYADSRITNVKVNDKGVLRIETEWVNDRGASGSDTYVARFQNNDFYLIGYDCTYNNPPTTYSFNLLTGKAVTVSGYAEDTKRKTSAIKKLPLKKLSEMKIGEYKCEDYYEY